MRKRELLAGKQLTPGYPSDSYPPGSTALRPRQKEEESSAILWLSIISNILCDTRATLWHFVWDVGSGLWAVGWGLWTVGGMELRSGNSGFLARVPATLFMSYSRVWPTPAMPSTFKQNLASNINKTAGAGAGAEAEAAAPYPTSGAKSF